MNFIEVFVLSAVEGLTEFIPVSSTGHMILISKMIGIEPSDFHKSFEIFIQLGAVIAVAFLYYKNIQKYPSLIFKSILAFIPSAIIGLIFYPIIKNNLLGNFRIVSYTLIIGGFGLMALDLFIKKQILYNNFHIEINLKHVFSIGCFQVLSFFPGVSRSAATITGGVLSGLSVSKALEFSFILSIPTMLAASVLDLLSSYQNFSSQNLIFLMFGFFSAFFWALISIKTFIKLVPKYGFFWFGVYRVVVGIITLIYIK